MNTFTFDFTKLMAGFQMENPVAVSAQGNGDPIVAYVNEYNGREYAHIRVLYQDRDGRWCPGKQGVSFPKNEIVAVLTKLVERFTAEPEAAPTIEQIADKHGGLPVEPMPQMGLKVGATTVIQPTERKPGIEGLRERMKGEHVTPSTAPTTEQWREFVMLVGQLSPENLTCDGELSRSQVQKKERQIRASWANLERIVGRKVTEEQVENWWSQQRKATANVPARNRGQIRRSR